MSWDEQINPKEYVDRMIVHQRDLHYITSESIVTVPSSFLATRSKAGVEVGTHEDSTHSTQVAELLSYHTPKSWDALFYPKVLPGFLLTTLVI